MMASRSISQGQATPIPEPAAADIQPERTSHKWKPASLLCKLFNVAIPFPNEPAVIFDTRRKVEQLQVVGRDAMDEILLLIFF